MYELREVSSQREHTFQDRAEVSTAVTPWKAYFGMHTLIPTGVHLHWYGATVGTLLLLKLLLSIRRRRKPDLVFRHHSRGYYVHGVVTV